MQQIDNPTIPVDFISIFLSGVFFGVTLYYSTMMKKKQKTENKLTFI